MAFDLSGILDAIKTSTRTAVKRLGDTDNQRAVRKALLQYSEDCPRQFAEEVSGTNPFELPAGFEVGFSIIEHIETPTGSAPPQFVHEGSDYHVVALASGTRLNFETTPTLPMLVKYKALHTLQDFNGASATTIPSAHHGAFEDLAAGHASLLIADTYAGSESPPLAGDTVNYATKADTWRAQALEKFKQYARVVLKKEDGAAIRIMDMDVPRRTEGIGQLWQTRRKY